MKKLVIGALAVVGALAIAGTAVLVFALVVSMAGRPRVPARTVLELDLQRGVIEVVPDDPFAQFAMEDQLTIPDVVDALERAAADRRVKGLVARVAAVPMGLAHIQEIRDSVQRFRQSGKPAIAYAETFGEFGPGNGAYYLATAFDEIYLQPSGDVGLTGLMYETPFLRGTLEKLGMEPRLGARHEYKNAANIYTEREYTASHREAMQTILDSQFEQIVGGIAAARGLEPAAAAALFDAGPYLGQEALDAGLVDGLAYRDEVRERVLEVTDGRCRFLYLDKYLERAGRPHRRGTTIALVHGYGTILRGPSAYSPLDGSVVMGSDTVAGALRSALDDRRVKAIVFRVDSPGGSAVASDTIWRETIRSHKLDKPIIVSMGNLAGSGGYFVAMGADRIVAQPGTITGSIGVYGGKILTRGFWDKLGVSFDDVASSAHSRIWSSHHDYNAGENERLQAMLDRVYEDFTEKVASGRGLEIDRVREVARGRIWTGDDAKELGLVDELGGLDVAYRLAREAIGLEADAPIRVKRFPPRRSPWEMLLGQRPDSSERALMRSLAQALRAAQPTVRVLREAGWLGDRQTLAVQDVGPVE